MRSLMFKIWMFIMISCNVIQAQINVELNGLKIGIDKDTGGIISLEHKALGQFVEDNTGGWLFDLACPVKDFVPLRTSILNSHAEIISKNNGLEIKYDSVGLTRNIDIGGNIKAVVKITAADDGKSLAMNCRIENNSKIAVKQILFPDIKGLKPFDGKNDTRLKMARGDVYPFLKNPKAKHAASFYAIDSGWKHYPAKGFSYGPNCLRWLDFGSLKGGISIFQQKWAKGERPDIYTFVSDKDPEVLRVCWEHHKIIKEPASIEPGHTWESGNFIFTPHEGSWAKGIETYRKFVKKENSKRLFSIPDHITTSAAYQTIWMIEHLETNPDKAYFKYKDLPAIALDAKKYGITEIVLWSWSKKGFWLPFRTNPLLGTEEEFIQGIKEARHLGVNIVPFVSIQIIHRDQMARYGKTKIQPDSEYTYHHDLIPPFNPAYTKEFAFGGAGIEPDNVIWQKDVKKAFQYWFDKGITSFAWDVFGFWQIKYRKPLLDLVISLRKAARKIDPDSTFAAESVSPTGLEWDGQLLDYTWNWTSNLQGTYEDYIDAGPILNVLKGRRLNCLVESSELTAKQAFADGLILTVLPKKQGQANGSALLSSQPALASTIADLSERRIDFIDYFRDGLFIGNGILSEKSKAFVRAHLLEEKLLIIVLNKTQNRLNEKIILCPQLWLKEGDYNLHSYNISGISKNCSKRNFPSDNILKVELKPLEILFFEFSPHK